MNDVSYVTEEGMQRLKAELDQLKRVERPSISKQIAEARDKGDLSENAEYDAAKEAQGLLEMKISKMENALANIRLIDESKIDTDTVQILNKVKIKNLDNNTVMEYSIVSPSEADLKQKKLSVNTPIAKGLLGKSVGEQIEVNVPNGLMRFEIIEISI
ncbi:MAG: transcription elongation factor GreA [Bacteroidota bacterium]|nr:transcription elongation factor GreA [Bacteroidota bacterium]